MGLALVDNGDFAVVDEDVIEDPEPLAPSAEDPEPSAQGWCRTLFAKTDFTSSID